jgi:hypothetical protein
MADALAEHDRLLRKAIYADGATCLPPRKIRSLQPVLPHRTR